MIHLFTYIDSKYPSIVPHFLKYYVNYLGIKNHKVILHSEKNDSNRKLCIKYLNEYNITPTMVDSYSSQQKMDAVNEFIKNLDNDDWLIYPDVDEFFCYPNTLRKFLCECDKDNVTIVRGVFLDRMSHDKELKTINNKESIWKQFPHELAHGGLSQILGVSPHKVVALKAKYEYESSHWLKEEGITKSEKVKYRREWLSWWPIKLNHKTHKYFHEILPVYHFRCDHDLYEKTKNRVNKIGNYDNHPKSLKFYEQVNSCIKRKDNRSFLDMPDKTKQSLILY